MRSRATIWLGALALATSIARAAEPADFSGLAEHVGRAVVNIGTTLRRPQGPPGVPPGFQLPDIPPDSPLYEFFRRFLEDGDGGPNGVRSRSSLGSGFIISSDGYIVSNYHVVKDAGEITVRLSDRREFSARIVGTDEYSDLALLKVEASGLPAVGLGDPEALRIGEWVLAIGSPFGFDYSVTAGIVSAKGRSLPNENYVPFIQTDVAVNPGNSGGPLFNLRGQVVGVNSQIYSRTGGFMGLSFAIPADVVDNVYRQLREHGSVKRGWLGVLIQDVTRELAKSFAMPTTHGALVSKVVSDGPAAAAGLRAGDVIVEFNGVAVTSSAALPPLVGGAAIGEPMPVTIVRGGEQQTLQVVIGELPASDGAVLANVDPVSTGEEMRVGLQVRDSRVNEGDGSESPAQGVVVEQVEDGPARDAGIRVGDRIALVDNEKVRDRAHFRELVGRLPTGRSIPVLIQRSGGPVFLALKLPADPD
jgi:serine protease Do